MNGKDKLIKLLVKTPQLNTITGSYNEWEKAAEFLIENGIVIINPTERTSIERQIPKKPTKSGTGHYYKCPGCDRFITQHEQSNGNIDIPHCKWCGQALDWSQQEQGKNECNNDSA